MWNAPESSSRTLTSAGSRKAHRRAAHLRHSPCDHPSHTGLASRWRAMSLTSSECNPRTVAWPNANGLLSSLKRCYVRSIQ
jgi:hypothetical protein